MVGGGGAHVEFFFDTLIRCGVPWDVSEPLGRLGGPGGVGGRVFFWPWRLLAASGPFIFTRGCDRKAIDLAHTPCKAGLAPAADRRPKRRKERKKERQTERERKKVGRTE